MRKTSSMRRYLPGFALIALSSSAVALYGLTASVLPQIPSHSSAAATPDLPLFHATTDLVLLDALVVDSKNNPPTARLDASDFLLTENGTPQTVLYCSRNQLPLSIVMLFDVSDTVQSELTSLGAKALAVLGHLSPEDEVAVMTFSSTTQLLQPFTRDHQAIAAAIQKAAHSHSKEATFINEVMDQAANEAGKATIPKSRRVLLFFTDGTSNSPVPYSRKISPSAPARIHSRAEAQRNLLQHGITVSALIERSALTEALLVEENVNPFDILLSHALGYSDDGKRFQHYAELTGGPYLKGGNADAATKLIELIKELHNRYTLGYRPSSSCSQGSFCRISLRFSRKALEHHPELKANPFKIETQAGYFKPESGDFK